MLSTRRLLRATKLLCDIKTVEGTKRCSFHVLAVKNSTTRLNHAFRRKQQPFIMGFVKFASTEAPVEPAIDATSQVLRELGILPVKRGQTNITSSESEIDSYSAETHFSTVEAPLDALLDPNAEESVAALTPAILEDVAASTSELLEGVSELAAAPDPIAAVGEIAELTPDFAATVVENIGKLAEPSLQSVGLGSWSPVGIVQQSLEYFHIALDLPWWGSIALGTLIIRLAVFPMVVMSQRNAAKMNNNLPEMQAIQLKMSDARQRGDRLDAARYAQELVEFMKIKGLNPLKNMLVPMCQAPFFISMFMGIRGMANLPVESFHQGGLWWFVDLTIPDQFYLLPLITSATLALTVEVGTDMGRLNSSNMGMAKYVLRGMPLLIFPFTLNFPSGVLVYWTSTNFISLAQVAILRIPAVRDYFKIDRLQKFDKKALPMKDKGFIGGMKESWTNLKISKELEDRERLDNSNFLRAGRGAIKKTYKFDPTTPRPPRNLSSIQLKKRD